MLEKKFNFIKAKNMMFILPAIALNLVFFVLPFLKCVYMSFFDWKLLGDKVFIGIDNYLAIFSDQRFMSSLVFTLKYAVIVTPCLFILAFILAILVNHTFKGVAIFRAIYFAPVIISLTTCSMVWIWIYNDLYGILNYALLNLGIIDKNIIWMGNASTSLPAIIYMITWKMAGFTMLILISAFNSIDLQVYEAADIDGTSIFTKFFHITLPLIRSYVGLAMIMSVMGSVLAFEQFTIMTKGGPSSTTTTLVHYIYNTSFQYFRFGYGSAMSIILLILLALLSWFQLKVLRDPTE